MMDIEYLLTATPSARKSLDLDAPVDLGDIRQCLRAGRSFRPARRRSVDEVVARDGWDGPAL